MESSGLEFSVNDINERLGLDLSYTPLRADIAWHAWKASRAALCVKLPSMTNNGYEGFYSSSSVIAAIKGAGVSHE